MKNLILLVASLTLVGCMQSRIPESKWIEKEKEIIIATIENKGEKSFLNVYGNSFEIKEDDSDYKVVYRNQEIPLVLDADNGVLVFNEVVFIPYSQSVKNKFVGQWKSKNSNDVIDIQIDENMNLKWLVIEDSKKPIEFWPKRTEKGFYYTYGYEERSYIVSDSIMVDNKGMKYARVTDM